jgi:hypothetical protein
MPLVVSAKNNTKIKSWYNRAKMEFYAKRKGKEKGKLCRLKINNSITIILKKIQFESNYTIINVIIICISTIYMFCLRLDLLMVELISYGGKMHKGRHFLQLWLLFCTFTGHCTELKWLELLRSIVKISQSLRKKASFQNATRLS